MWQRFMNWITRRAAIPLAMRRPSPERIPLTGEAVRLRHYHTVRLEGPGESSFRVEEVSPHGLIGYWNERPGVAGVPFAVPNNMVGTYRLQITSYLGELQLSYDSAPITFVIHQVTFWPWFLLARERLAARFFNRRDLGRAGRIEVLRDMVEQTMLDANFSSSPLDFLTRKHGVRWAEHPDNMKLQNYQDLLFESLADEGSLIRETGYYRLGQKALGTLANFEEEDRRHQDNIGIQRRIAWLTVGLLIAALAQATVTYLTSARTP